MMKQAVKTFSRFTDFDIAQWQVPLLRTLCGESALPDKNKELTPLLINDDSLLSGSRR